MPITLAQMRTGASGHPGGLSLASAHGITACNHALRLAQLTCSTTAYCKARARLPLAIYKQLLKETTQAARTNNAIPLWHGHRTLVIDGTGISMSDTEELRHYFGAPGQQAEGCSFPVALLLAWVDSATGLLIDTWAKSAAHARHERRREAASGDANWAASTRSSSIDAPIIVKPKWMTKEAWLALP